MEKEGPINVLMPEWLKWKSTFESWMGEAGLSQPIDEVALLFYDQNLLNDFLLLALAGEGVKAFNTSVDSVRTMPFDTEYKVRYVFLEDGMGFLRVELMTIEHVPYQFSPLHYALLVGHVPELRPLVVHLSFKCKNVEEYRRVCSILNDSAWCVQSCVSSYGNFAYYRVEDLTDGSGLFLKPRVNLQVREEVKVAPMQGYAEQEEDDRGDFGFPTLGKNGLF